MLSAPTWPSKEPTWPKYACFRRLKAQIEATFGDTPAIARENPLRPSKSLKTNVGNWRRGWDSNPRAGYPTSRFRGGPVTTTSVPLRRGLAARNLTPAGDAVPLDRVLLVRPTRRPPRLEEALQQLAALVRQDPFDDLDAVVQRRVIRACWLETTAPAFGSRAPKISVPTRAWTIAPTHIRHGSTVT